MLHVLKLAESKYCPEYNVPAKFHLNHVGNIKEKCINSIGY